MDILTFPRARDHNDSTLIVVYHHRIAAPGSLSQETPITPYAQAPTNAINNAPPTTAPQASNLLLPLSTS